MSGLAEKFDLVFHGGYTPDTRYEHPLTVIDQAFLHCAMHHKKWGEMLTREPQERIPFQEGVLKQVILQSMDKAVKEHYRSLTPEQQALPIRAMPRFDPPPRRGVRGGAAAAEAEEAEAPRQNYYDHFFVPHFEIPSVEEHARNTLSLMRSDRSTKETYIERLQRVNKFYQKDPSIGFTIATDAFLNAFQNDSSDSAMALRMLGVTQREWPAFFEQARRVAVKPPRLKNDPAPSPHSAFGYANRNEDELESRRGSSSTQPGGGKRKYSNEEKRSFNKGKRWAEKKAKYSAVNSVAPMNQDEPDSVVNTLKNLLGIAGSSGGGNRVNSVQQKKADRYEHNPKGKEHWYKWFRVCSNCRRWCAHFARHCQETEHSDNQTNPPTYNNPTPLNAYPKDFSQAMDLARSEKRKYGGEAKFNCRPEDWPKL